LKLIKSSDLGTSLPEWSKYVKRLPVTKKQLKAAARHYGLNLRELYWYCDQYIKHGKFDICKTKVVFTPTNKVGKVVREPIVWGAACMASFYNIFARGGNWLEALLDFQNTYNYIAAEGRVNEYAHSIRENAMTLYYRGDNASDIDDDGCSSLLDPNQALDLAKLFAAYMMESMTIRSFVEGELTLTSPLHMDVSKETDNQKKSYLKIVAWITKVLWPRAPYIVKELGDEYYPVQALLEIINQNNANRRHAVFMLVLYCIGLNDFEGNIIYAAGDLPDEEESMLQINAMLEGKILEDVRNYPTGYPDDYWD
jgi:hypothetical protein